MSDEPHRNMTLRDAAQWVTEDPLYHCLGSLTREALEAALARTDAAAIRKEPTT